MAKIQKSCHKKRHPVLNGYGGNCVLAEAPVETR